MMYIMLVDGGKTFSTKSAQEFESYCRRMYSQLRLCDEHVISYVCCSEQEYNKRFGSVPSPDFG